MSRDHIEIEPYESRPHRDRMHACIEPYESRSHRDRMHAIADVYVSNSRDRVRQVGFKPTRPQPCKPELYPHAVYTTLSRPPTTQAGMVPADRVGIPLSSLGSRDTADRVGIP